MTNFIFRNVLNTDSHWAQVTWEGPDDPANPKNWSKRSRWAVSRTFHSRSIKYSPTRFHSSFRVSPSSRRYPHPSQRQLSSTLGRICTSALRPRSTWSCRFSCSHMHLGLLCYRHALKYGDVDGLYGLAISYSLCLLHSVDGRRRKSK